MTRHSPGRSRARSSRRLGRHSGRRSTPPSGSMRYRMVGPFRGGRSTAVTGVVEPAASGSTWARPAAECGGPFDLKPSWVNLTDRFLDVGSIRAIDVTPTPTERLIFAGTGSACIGETSRQAGDLEEHRRRRDLEVRRAPDPRARSGRGRPPANQSVHVAALAIRSGRTAKRGVTGRRTGARPGGECALPQRQHRAVSLAMNPENPQEIYAGDVAGRAKAVDPDLRRTGRRGLQDDRRRGRVGRSSAAGSAGVVGRSA